MMDAQIASALEHHANLVPWQLPCAERGATLRIAPLDADGRVDAAALAAMLDEHVKLVAIAHLSNVLGTIAPVREVVAAAHAVGARVLVGGHPRPGPGCRAAGWRTAPGSAPPHRRTR